MRLSLGRTWLVLCTCWLLSACTADAQVTRAITFTTEGDSFAPVLVVEGTPAIEWTWSDGGTSREARPTKRFGTAARRTHALRVTPWSALRRINIGYDAGDGGSGEIERVPDQHVSAVTGLELVAPTLGQWCSSYNQIPSLEFVNFAQLDTIECFLSGKLTSVTLRNLPRLKRACFEDCDLRELDLTQCPALEDLRGAQNAYSTIAFGRIGAQVWHICVRDNPQMTDQKVFADLAQFPRISELFIWNDNQAGSIRIPATHPENGVALLADGNHYESLDLSGALRNAKSTASVAFRGNRLRQVKLDGCVQITELMLENNLLPAEQVDALLVAMDKLGRGRENIPDWTKPRIDLRGNAAPGEAGRAAMARLAAKGWTVAASDRTVQPPPPPNTGETRIDFVTVGDATHLRCDFDASASATWHWSDGTTAPAASGAAVARTGLGQGEHAAWLVISNGAALTRFGAADGGGQGHLTAIRGLEKAPALAILYVYNEGELKTLARTSQTRIREYHLLGTALSLERCDQVYADLVASGVRNGTIWCAKGTPASDADRAKAAERGWNLN
ncbi:MAG: hypothetical protein HZB16_17655 [Armatimonadetes bacterium]|nr:hypothetical protein [Armatimonadota bacterium]